MFNMLQDRYNPNPGQISYHIPDQLTFVLETGYHCVKKEKCPMSRITGCI